MRLCDVAKASTRVGHPLHPDTSDDLVRDTLRSGFDPERPGGYLAQPYGGNGEDEGEGEGGGKGEVGGVGENNGAAEAGGAGGAGGAKRVGGADPGLAGRGKRGPAGMLKVAEAETRAKAAEAEDASVAGRRALRILQPLLDRLDEELRRVKSKAAAAQATQGHMQAFERLAEAVLSMQNLSMFVADLAIAIHFHGVPPDDESYFPPTERPLWRNYGLLWPLRVLLKTYSTLNSHLLRSVPPSRLLVIPTHQLSTDGAKRSIERFLGIPGSTLNWMPHANVARGKRQGGAPRLPLVASRSGSGSAFAASVQEAPGAEESKSRVSAATGRVRPTRFH